MSTAKVLVYLAGWFVASVMMAVVAAVLVVEVARLVGVAESGTSSYTIVLTTVFLLTLVALLAVPVVFRQRFNRYEPPPPNA